MWSGDRRRGLGLDPAIGVKSFEEAWAFYVFSSANALAKYEMRELVELGVNWVWLGLESAGSSYGKLRGTDIRALTGELQAHGIHVLGSTIIGLEHHTPENIADEIGYAVAHDVDCHQFMLYTPVRACRFTSRWPSRGGCYPRSI